MERREALQALAAIRAAFPTQTIPDETIDLYAAQIQKLRDPDTMVAVVQRIVDTCRFWPSVAEIREFYFEENRATVPETRWLDEPDMTDEERAQNLERIRQLTSRIGRAV